MQEVVSPKNRAEWTDDTTAVRMIDDETGEAIVYSADDLVLATSNQEVRNTRHPGFG